MAQGFNWPEAMGNWWERHGGAGDFPRGMAALTPPGGLARPLSAQVADPAGYATCGEASVRGAQHARWGLPGAAARGAGSSRLAEASQPMETAGNSRQPAARSGVMPGAMQRQAWQQAGGGLQPFPRGPLEPPPYLCSSRRPIHARHSGTSPCRRLRPPSHPPRRVRGTLFVHLPLPHAPMGRHSLPPSLPPARRPQHAVFPLAR